MVDVANNILKNFSDHFEITYDKESESIKIEIKTDSAEEFIKELSEKEGYSSIEDYLKPIIETAIKLAAIK